RVVISDLPPEFPADPVATGNNFDVIDDTGKFFVINPQGGVDTTTDRDCAITASVELGVQRLVELFQEAKESEDGTAELDPANEEEVTLFKAPGKEVNADQLKEIIRQHGSVRLF